MPGLIVCLLDGEARRFIIYYDNRVRSSLCARNDMQELTNEAGSQVTHKDGKESRMSVLIRLEKLEEKILLVKGKERDKAVEMYRELLLLLKDEPIYLLRYE